MIDDIQKLLDDYVKWLKDKTTLREVKNWVEITTPYLDRHNDYLQIYAKRVNGQYLLTDDGYIINDLRLSGCELKTQKRQDLLRITLNGFGIQLNGESLEVKASNDNFASRKHNLLQSMLAINDLFYMAEPMVASLFLEDVTSWLDSNEIRYTPKVKFTGKSGYDHLFDFVIPASRKKPERIIHTINRPKRETAQAIAFAWIDTKEVRPPNSTAFAFLNDAEHSPHPSVMESLDNYEVAPILWSQREKVKEDLAA